MPIHDWTRVSEAAYHSFQLDWVARLSANLNRGLLPQPCYALAETIAGYIEPVAVGDALPDMPIFLAADRYVPCPLESTYQTSWDVFPKALKVPLLESP